MRTRMAQPRGVLLAAMAALILTGCTTADQQRWNEFWGLDSKGNARKVRGSKPTARSDALKAPAPKRTAKTDKDAKPAPSDRGDPDAIGAYADKMGDNREKGYQPNDHTSKMRRQADAKRDRRSATPLYQPTELPDDATVRTASDTINLRVSRIA